jgi:hypothetical protein
MVQDFHEHILLVLILDFRSLFSLSEFWLRHREFPMDYKFSFMYNKAEINPNTIHILILAQSVLWLWKMRVSLTTGIIEQWFWILFWVDSFDFVTFVLLPCQCTTPTCLPGLITIIVPVSLMSYRSCIYLVQWVNYVRNIAWVSPQCHSLQVVS